MGRTKTMTRRLAAPALFLFFSLTASGTLYQVGFTKPYPDLQSVADLLNPGDIVEVDGNETYPGGVTFERPGTAEQPIIIRGIEISGNRPVLSGGTNTVYFATPDPSDPADGANFYIFENFDVTGGSSRGIFHQAGDLIVRDTVVHDCPNHGILGADQGSGNCTLERVEVYNCGSGSSRHQIYMATDEVNRPGSVFRMTHCYLHDGIGGNNVKSRAERNEIYYNWLEGAYYHELELIGPDPGGAPSGWDEALSREDSDIVGNVLWQRNTFFIARVGGDATGQSWGRYRFVNNTIIAGTSAVFRLFDGMQSIEMHNNVICREDGSAPNIIRDVEVLWSDGEQIAGSNNWVTTGSANIPVQWTGTVTGADPGLEDLSSDDPRPASGSPLLGGAALDLSGPTGFPFPNPLFPPTLHPPMHEAPAADEALPRAFDCDLDIGAFERPASPAITAGLLPAADGSLKWAPEASASAYDVVKGDLLLLASSGGDFTASLLSCLEDDGADTAALDISLPASGEGFYYLVRAAAPSAGTYDCGCAAQTASRDPGIAASGLACP